MLIWLLATAFFAKCSFSSCFEKAKKNSGKKLNSTCVGRQFAQSLSPYSTEQLHQDEIS